MQISSNLNKSFLVLRSVFAGIASRHDLIKSEFTFAEEGYFDELDPAEHDLAPERNPIQHGRHMYRFPKPVKEFDSEEEAKRFDNGGGSLDVVQFKNLSNWGVVTRSAQFSYRTFGSQTAWKEFECASADAAVFLAMLANSTDLELRLPYLTDYEEIVPLRMGRIDYTMQWMLFLHALGWQNMNYSPIRAVREILVDGLRIGGNPDTIRQDWASSGNSGMADYLSKFPTPAKSFTSKLQQNLSLASVYAIDVLLLGRILSQDKNVNALSEELQNIEKGTGGATTYHRFIAK